MISMKHISVLISLLLLICSFSFAINQQAFLIDVNESVQVGDPLFITASFCSDSRYVSELYAELYAVTGTKPMQKSDFYQHKKNGFQTWATIVPVSIFVSAGSYTVVINYVLNTPGGRIEGSQSYPLTVRATGFIEETIHLDQRNTAIRTDSSPKKMAQIDRLNEVLFTINKHGVWHHVGSFSFPVTSTRRTSHFGDTRTFIYADGNKSHSYHYGIDYGIPTGTFVRSCARGKVVLAEDRITTGFTVVIEHLPGLYSLYYHLDSLSVEERQVVEQGEIIGKSGSTGLATGPHLHWEIRLNGVAVNPDCFVK